MKFLKIKQILLRNKAVSLIILIILVTAVSFYIEQTFLRKRIADQQLTAAVDVGQDPNEFQDAFPDTLEPMNDEERFTGFYRSDKTTFAQALVEKNFASEILPIYLNAYNGEVRMVLSESQIYPNYVVLVDIAGIDFFANNSNPNPEENIEARIFLDLFNQALDRIRDQGSMPERMIFKYTTEYQYENIIINWIKYNNVFKD